MHLSRRVPTSATASPLRSPVIALRRNSIPSLQSGSSDESNTSNELLKPSRSNSMSSTSSMKLTGAPGYVVIDPESQSPTKILPTNPRHVRGGSITSDLSDICGGDSIIPMQVCPADTLVPLLHRHLEMAQLINCNRDQFARLQASIGHDRYKELEQLWTQTTRVDVDDEDWLLRTKQVLTSRPDWSLFCEMVGWDATRTLSAKSSLTVPPFLASERRGSTISLLETQPTIHEEEEY